MRTPRHRFHLLTDLSSDSGRSRNLKAAGEEAQSGRNGILQPKCQESAKPPPLFPLAAASRLCIHVPAKYRGRGATQPEAPATTPGDPKCSAGTGFVPTTSRFRVLFPLASTPGNSVNNNPGLSRFCLFLTSHLACRFGACR